MENGHRYRAHCNFFGPDGRRVAGDERSVRHQLVLRRLHSRAARVQRVRINCFVQLLEEENDEDDDDRAVNTRRCSLYEQHLLHDLLHDRDHLQPALVELHLRSAGNAHLRVHNSSVRISAGGSDAGGRVHHPRPIPAVPAVRVRVQERLGDELSLGALLVLELEMNGHLQSESVEV